MAHYFDNELVENWIKEYKETDDEHLLNKIMYELYKVIDGTIHTHKFYRFGFTFEELRQIAAINCFKQIKNFNPEFWVKDKKRKTKAFHYFSIITKRSLQQYTIRENEKRKRYNFVDVHHLPQLRQQTNFEMLVYDLEKSFKSIFELKKTKRYKPLFKFFCNYLRIENKWNKNDFIHKIYNDNELWKIIAPRSITEQSKYRHLIIFFKILKTHKNRFL